MRLEALEDRLLLSDGLLASGDGVWELIENPYSHAEANGNPLVQTTDGFEQTTAPTTADGAPASFDLRGSGVTDVRDQGGCGSCWTFATYGALESYLLVTESTTEDFSENHLKNYHGFDWGPCDGGNMYLSAAYLSRGDGPVYEEDDPYHDWDDRPSPGGDPGYYVGEILIYDTVDEIKAALQATGALHTSMYWASSSYRSADCTYYYTGGTGTNHAVTIVGWDDTKDTAADTDGAWLIRNSWGSDWGDGGYFWISYADTAAVKYGTSYQETTAADTYSTIYSYDYFGDVGELNPTYAFNAFTPTADEQLTTIGFWTQADGAGYEICIYDTFSGGVLSDLLTTETGTIATAGYHTVDLASPITLSADDTFYVYVHLTDGGAYPHAFDRAVADYSSTATASAGQSYYSFNGTSWTDLTTFDSTANFSIKALTQTLDTVADNGDDSYEESGDGWITTAASAQGYEADYRACAPGSGENTATWTLTDLAAGWYTVSVTWQAHSSRATDSPFSVYDNTTLEATIDVDQQLSPDDSELSGAWWESLGTYYITSGTLKVVLTDDADGYVIADAVRADEASAPTAWSADDGDWNYSETGDGWLTTSSAYNGFEADYRACASGSGGNTATWTITGLSSGWYEVLTTWQAHSSRASDAPYSVFDNDSLEATLDLDQRVSPDDASAVGASWESLGTFNITSGTLTVTLTDDGDGYVIADAIRLVEGTAPTEWGADDGDWNYSESGDGWLTTAGSYAGAEGDYRLALAGAGANTATWTLTGLDAGWYEVLATWCAYSARASDAPYSLYDDADLEATVDMDQRLTPDDAQAAGVWYESLGTYYITSGTLEVVLSDDADGHVVADSIRVIEGAAPTDWNMDDGDWNYSEAGAGWFTNSAAIYGYEADNRACAPGDGDNTATWTLTGLSAGWYTVSATWYSHWTRATDSPFSVHDNNGLEATVDVNQQIAPDDSLDDGKWWETLGTFYISTGTLKVQLSDDANGYVIADGIRVEAVSEPTERIADDGDTAYSESGAGWLTTGASYRGHESDCRLALAGSGSNTATWTFTNLSSGTYEVYTTWVPYKLRASNAPYIILDDWSTETSVSVDQRVAPDDVVAGGTSWELIATVKNDSVILRVQLSDNANGHVVADAIRIVKVGGEASSAPDATAEPEDASGGDQATAPSGDATASPDLTADLVAALADLSTPALSLAAAEPAAEDDEPALDTPLADQPIALLTADDSTWTDSVDQLFADSMYI